MEIELEYGVETRGTPRTEVSKGGKSDLVNLQMVLVTSSMNHEYARKAYVKTRSYDKKQELLERMEHLKSLYYNARKQLITCYPDRVSTIETELNAQKQAFFAEREIH